MATEYGEKLEEEAGMSEEGEPASDFDFAADAFITAIGATPSSEARSALKEVVHACLDEGYGDKKKPEKAKKSDGSLALVFGGEK